MANYFGGGGGGGKRDERPGQAAASPPQGVGTKGAGSTVERGASSSAAGSTDAGGAGGKPGGDQASGASGVAPGGGSSLLPAVSLPQGGGAIRGIGEKFSVNAATGTASLSVPLAASPGRSGFGPEVALGYDSGSGNSPFGLGFQLSIPMVSRKTDKGLPRYIDDAESDEFIVSGAEDLVPTLDASGNFLELPPRQVDGTNYRIRRYRPRTEGAFARIERWIKIQPGDPTDGDVHWRVTGRDNITSIYGLSPTARIADPAFPAQGRNARIFSWLLEQTHDDKGNIVRYEYKAENGAGVDKTRSSEKNRFNSGGFAATAQRYLKRVFYCNAAPFVAGDFLMEMVFDYGEHLPAETTASAVPTPEEDEDTPWPVRQDPFSTYRATFEVRTYRLCRRVLMFHRFAAPIAGVRPALLVKSTDFTYEEGPAFTYLTGVTQAGYLKDASTGNVWQRKTLPTLALDYSRPLVNDELTPLATESLHGLEGGVDGARKQWVDLDGEGIPGVLIDHENGWFYKPNRGKGELDAPRQLTSMPSPAVLSGGFQQLEDLGGDGQLDLVAFGEPLQGYFSRTAEGSFEPLRQFGSVPNIDFNDPNLRSIDLDGDGLPDLLITEDHAFVWYRSRGKAGFDPLRRLVVPTDDDKGPAIVFADAEQSIQLADMSGDGLTDIVRIRNGEISYWPNLGYGKFGKKVTLENSPLFTSVDQFDARRVRFGDIDGTGTSDIFYLGPSETKLYFNQAGNGFSAATPINSLPPVDNLTSLSIVDLLGQGTACLVWSSPLQTPRPLFFVDLMGGEKPHLMKKVANNLGAETRLTYATSTKFYLEDKANGIPWLTRLSFPVHVVEKIERFDHISKSHLVSTYRYRHGFFDGAEREFRGFARVEQRDAEEFTVGPETELFQAPVKTVSWFHTGAWLERERLEQALALEYFPPGPKTPEQLKMLLADTVLPVGLTLQDEREAARALRGRMLRQEIYAEDDDPDKADKPYLTTEQNFEVKLLQKTPTTTSTDFAKVKHAVFFAHARESVAIHSERNPTDPRVTHELILDVDAFGNVKRKVAVAYGRASGETKQQKSWATLSESDFTNEAGHDDWYRLGIEFESRSFELTGFTFPAGGTALVALGDLKNDIDALLPVNDLAFEAVPTTGRQRRLLDRKQQLFYNNALTAPLALGVVESLALPYESYQLALTTGIVSQIVTDSLALSGTAFDPALLLTEGKYVQRDANYWTASGRVLFDVAHFYLPVEAIDPFGNHFFVTHDAFSLLVESTRDPLDNLVQSVNDYRVLAPAQITDPNLNRGAVAFDALGMVVKTAVMGKAGAGEGDTLDDPTTRLEYDLLRFQIQQEPSFVHTFARERHGPTNPRWQETFAYSDGFGRVAMQKVQAEPERGTTTPRWVGTGRTIFNNKGNPVKQYEPFFSATSDFEDEDDIVATGVTPIIHYDPLDRVIRTDLPDGTFSKVEFDCWSQKTWDQNDTVLDSQWFIDRGSPAPSGPEPSAPNARAAWLAAQHAGTPTTAQLDSLGRPFLSDAHNRTDGADDHYLTRNELDVEGNTLAIFDARQIKLHELTPSTPLRSTIAQTFDVLQRRLKVVSADAGTRLMVADVAGKPLRAWDSRHQTHRQRFDALQRPTHGYVRKGATERLLLRTVYGEALDPPGAPPTNPASASTAQQANLRGKPVYVFDCAGLVTSIACDFKGNLLSASRRLAVAYQTEPDWSPGENLSSAADILNAIQTATPPRLQDETFTTETKYDALNRVVSAAAPDGSPPSGPSVTFPIYNEANLLEALDVSVRGASPSPVVNDLDYNARGQRVRCEYANGTVTTYDYDPKTFRLVQLTTLRGTTKLQHLLYSYDPVGNITDLQDLSNWDPVLTALTASGITGSGKYRYDAVYRLLSATGREHPGPQPGGTSLVEPPLWGIPHGNDLQALQSYREELSYDAVGNILEMRHLRGASNNASWSRRYDYFLENNRLRATSAPGDLPDAYSDPYGYEDNATNDAGAHGSMTRMPHLAAMEWDYADRLKHTLKSNGSAQDTYFTYDASGQRVRKVYQHDGVIEERIYLGGYEVYRRHTSGAITVAPTEERQTLHVMDDQRRVAMAETKTRDAGAAVSPAVTRWRFQLDNHLGSATLELDAGGGVISYEEYHPYGSTAFHTADGNAEVSAKRYRYTGKEKDDETGLYYHGARYYAPWLGRWIAADPLGLHKPGRADLNLFAYVRGRSTGSTDPSGLDDEDAAVRGMAAGRAAAEASRVAGYTGAARLSALGIEIKDPRKAQEFDYDVNGTKVKGYYVPGQDGHAQDVALIYGGIHGNEFAGKEVGNRTVRALTQEGADAPEFTTIIIPDIYGGTQTERKLQPGNLDPNRSFPRAGKTLDEAPQNAQGQALDARPVPQPIPAAIQQIIRLREALKPERILQLHGVVVRPGSKPLAGITSDARKIIDAAGKEQTVDAAQDLDLAARMARFAAAGGARVTGNDLGGKGETFVYPTEERKGEKGTTGGQYFQRGNAHAPAANVILIETYGNEDSQHVGPKQRSARERELDAFAQSIIRIFLRK